LTAVDVWESASLLLLLRTTETDCRNCKKTANTDKDKDQTRSLQQNNIEIRFSVDQYGYRRRWEFSAPQATAAAGRRWSCISIVW
jgi:hypothetical protein